MTDNTNEQIGPGIHMRDSTVMGDKIRSTETSSAQFIRDCSHFAIFSLCPTRF
jgi:hypothetical protein